MRRLGRARLTCPFRAAKLYARSPKDLERCHGAHTTSGSCASLYAVPDDWGDGMRRPPAMAVSSRMLIPCVRWLGTAWFPTVLRLGPGLTHIGNACLSLPKAWVSHLDPAHPYANHQAHHTRCLHVVAFCLALFPKDKSQPRASKAVSGWRGIGVQILP